MAQIKNPITRFLIYLALALFALLTSVPFGWTILQSLKTLREANARTPIFIFRPNFNAYVQLWFQSVPDNFLNLAGLLIGGILLLTIFTLIMKRLGASSLITCGVVIACSYLILWSIPRMFDTSDFYDFFLNTVVVTVGTTLIAIWISCLAGYGLARFRGLDGVVILVTALAFRALPRMALALPFFQLGHLTGLNDTYFILILVLVAANQPFAVWMLRSFFEDIPKEIEESAMVDGASRFKAFSAVVMPVMWPGIVSTALFIVLLAYHEFLLVRVLTQSKWTLSVAITQYLSPDATATSVIPFAASVSATLPLLIVILIFQKQLLRGLTAGAVKG